ncbi:discoidin domain-containing protein [Actinoplanes friuliensis]|uniref:Sialidase n=1 Tax=Actinoplanes friuliensis DSM 7358 TaxID=1246995 RepID=U5W4W1_9ACTN|nr:discoidin domain-containing protein [Actinoplanes friuliensis]AGZ44159.1 Sialidase [Actinoplanes friuliensis DSM 7358]
MRIRTAASACAVALVAAAALVAGNLHGNAFAADSLSAGRSATASSATAGNTAAKAVDGDSGTRWESAQGLDPQWLQVDLGSAQALGRVELDWERAAAKSYSLQLSDDGQTWRTVYSTTTSAGGKQSVPVSGTGRFVRMYGTARTTQYGYSLYEFGVYAPDGTGGQPSPSGAAAISGVSLIDNTARQPVAGFNPLRDGATVDLAQLAHRTLSLRADPSSGAAVGSVFFTLTGAGGNTYTRVESKAPYFLCNDFIDCPQLLVAGTYTVTVQAYTGADRQGAVLGAPLTVHFTVRGDAAPTDALDVLFIGNSLIGTRTGATNQDTADVVKSLAATSGRALNLTEVIHFGNTLQETWDAGEVKSALSSAKKYDLILLQEQSTLVTKNFAAAEKALLDTYAPAVVKNLEPGGRVLLFENWALADNAGFPSRAANVAAIESGYARLSAELTVPNTIVPISDAFEKIIAADGTSGLIVADGRHPNDKAIYLDAAVLYGILFTTSPENLAGLYLPAATAARLRAVAADVLGY